MSDEKAVSEHYLHGNLLQTIQASLDSIGKTADSVTLEDLAPVDEFHIGGRQATEHFMNQLHFSRQHHVLDVGCGLGGAARYVASTYASRVTGIDLTREYVDTGTALCAWLKLDEQISLHHGSALSMPFANEAFDGAYMMHVGMNIEDKSRLFSEIGRVLRPGASLGIYDVMRIKDGELAYPVPWAADRGTSSLATPEQYRQALRTAGFDVAEPNNRSDFALEFFRMLRARMESGGGTPALGLHLLMKETTSLKIKNMIDNIVANTIAPVEMIAQKA